MWEAFSGIVRPMYTLLKAFKTGTTIAPEARSRLASMGWPEKAEALVREYSKYDAVLKKYRNDPAGVKVSCTTYSVVRMHLLGPLLLLVLLSLLPPEWAPPAREVLGLPCNGHPAPRLTRRSPCRRTM